MTQKEALSLIKTYLRMNNVEAEELIFTDHQEAVYNGRTLFLFDYDSDKFEIYTPDGDNICTLEKNNMIELFIQFELNIL